MKAESVITALCQQLRHIRVLCFNWLIVSGSTHCVSLSLQLRPLQTFPAAFGLLSRLHLIYIQLSLRFAVSAPHSPGSPRPSVCGSALLTGWGDWFPSPAWQLSGCAPWFFSFPPFRSARSPGWSSPAAQSTPRLWIILSVMVIRLQTSLIVSTSLWNLWVSDLALVHAAVPGRMVPCRAKHYSAVKSFFSILTINK